MAGNMINSLFLIIFLLVLQVIRSPAEILESSDEDKSGTRWAVLIAGSNEFSNYRHQADICHAYQILKKGGLKDENIVVFMYDDIAKHEMNPRPGQIINRPDGEDVYAGVPKDYTGDNVTVDNIFAAILGDKKAIKGGSGKVVNSTKDDRIFIYYSDHGGPGVLGVPPASFLFAQDFVDVLKKKHKSGTYKEMVLYVESCESGSIFEDLLPEDLNIYVTTASNAVENSYATYCSYKNFPCLGDLYSVAWMEDSESHDLRKESLGQQYQRVKERASNNNTYGSHVMEYGNKSMNVEKLSLFQGFNPITANNLPSNLTPPAVSDVVEQRSADLYFLWKMYKMEDNAEKKNKLLKQIKSITLQRENLDGNIGMIGNFLFGPKSSSVVNGVGKPGLVDDWECLKSSVRAYEKHCGSLTQYGMKYMRKFANICNVGTGQAALEKACETACNLNKQL